MTSLHLSILNHYYACGDDYPEVISNKVRTRYAWTLCRRGLLYRNDVNEPFFKITNCGKIMIKKLLKILEGSQLLEIIYNVYEGK